MPEGDWADQHRDSVLPLVGQQLDYITRGETGDQSATRLEETILNKKFGRLAHRIQYLIEDLGYLHEASFIDTEQWEDLWDPSLDESEQAQLLDQALALSDPETGEDEADEAFDPMDQELVRKALLPPPNNMPTLGVRNRVYKRPFSIKNTRVSEQVQVEFGIQLGHLARLMAKDGVDEFDETALASGFVLGVAGQAMNDPWNEADGAGETDSRTLVLKGPTEEITEAFDEIRESLIDAVDSGPASFERAWAAEYLEENGVEPLEVLVDEVVERAEAHEYPVFDYTLKMAAASVASDDALRRADVMADTVADEIGVLVDYSWRGSPTALEILAGACSASENKKDSVRDKVREFRRDKPGEQLIRKPLNDIMGTGTNPRHWEDYPLVSGEINPTAFGELIGLIVGPYSQARDTHEYLPGTEEDGLFVVPSRVDVRVACLACALGRLGDDKRELFDEAFAERV